MTHLEESNGFAGQELSGKRWRVRVITEGKGSSANYKGEVLKRDIGLFKAGAKIYMDHAGQIDQENRPERSAKEIVGYFTNDATWDEAERAVFQEAHIFSDHREWVKERALAGVIGMSISAEGEVEESDTGDKDLVRLTKVNSVDIVTEAGRGGKFSTLLESKGAHTADAPEEEDDMEFPKELAESLDAQNKDVKDLVTAVQALIVAVTPPAPEVVESKKPTYTEIDTAVTEAELPAPSRAAVFTAVEAGTDLAEAVNAEKAKVDAITESMKDKGVFGNVEDEDKNSKLSEAEQIKAASKSIFG
ncbi:capsid maturation protease [Arthrobacter phage Molivia]|uniref:Capsid maturation protease n=1 Tax=Arthrobacter phage Molivia TaxID=2015839 RepID=A0A286N4E5_9CAUD|nr:head maturation protease [Arthrobacter phage Molivia]ASX99252.1 capsid maturation protease [Arthrobacter phage Molivia]